MALGAMGCDAGGLIQTDTTDNPAPKTGVQANDMVSGGTVAKNSKYTVVYTMGQPTPQSRVTGSEKTLNGGVVGATQPN
ncbi:MAG TPA: hypothetical protein PKA58_04190 [Polyangium sp.]|nr:hypothetical protein [Polyangium sp.]